jgi:hypothetical protein
MLLLECTQFTGTPTIAAHNIAIAKALAATHWVLDVVEVGEEGPTGVAQGVIPRCHHVGHHVVYVLVRIAALLSTFFSFFISCLWFGPPWGASYIVSTLSVLSVLKSNTPDIKNKSISN